MPHLLGNSYKSPSQKARVVTEAWASRELYCPSCLAPALDSTPVNYQATDYICPACTSPFQLKSSKSGIGIKVPDGAYQAMIAAIRNDRTPNLLLLSCTRNNVASFGSFDHSPFRIFRAGNYPTQAARFDRASRRMDRLQHRSQPNRARSPNSHHPEWASRFILLRFGSLLKAQTTQPTQECGTGVDIGYP